ncbi:MAG: Ig domain-containing protein [Acidobacteriota bacterium]
MRLALLCALALALEAQTPFSLQITSDSSQVLVGRTLQLRAVARDAGGNVIANAGVNWSSNNATAASVSTSGLVTANLLAVVRITARLGNLVAETAIQTIPSRVAITPATARVTVSSTQQFMATAFDADGSAIPGVTWTWSVTNLRNGGSQTATVNTAGLMRATAEGANLVWATFNYNDVQTGLQRQWITSARVETTVERSYQVRRLYHNLQQIPGRYQLRARQSMIWATEDGGLFFNASLDGLAGGLMHYRDGSFALVSAAGMPRFASGSFASEFFIHSITRDGRILSHEDTNINGRQLSLGDRNGLTPFFSNNTVLAAGTEATSGVTATRHSLTTGGNVLIRASFRYEGDPTTYAGIFRGFNNRIVEMLISSRDNPSDVPGTGAITVDGDYGIAEDGTAFYSVTRAGIRVVYRHPPSQERTKLIATNDALLDSTVRAFNAGRGNQPNFWVEESNAALLLSVTLQNNTTHLVAFDREGKVQNLRCNSLSGILSHHPGQGTLIHAQPFNTASNGVYLWRPGTEPRAIFQYSRPSVAGANLEDIESGAINGRGEIFLMARTSTANMAIAKMGANPEYLVYSGQDLKVEAPVNLITLIGGARSGPPHVLAGGTTGSIAEFDGVDFFPRLAIGERLFGGMFFGCFHGGTANTRKAPNGDIYAVVPAGVARITGNGNPELLIPFPLRDGSLSYNLPSQIEVNAAGDVLMHGSTSAGDNRFYVWSGGRVSNLLNLSATAITASTIDNRIVSGFDSFALGDDGRVLASLRFRNVAVPVLYLYANQSWTRLAEPNLTVVGPHRVTGIANLHRTGAGRLFAVLTIQAGGNILVEWKGSDWEILINNSSIMPHGQVATTVVNIDANRRGDVLFQHSNGGNNFLLVRRADSPERLRQVINLFRPTAEGDYLVRINAIDFRDDGTVYFLAMTADDETVLYEAKPVN